MMKHPEANVVDLKQHLLLSHSSDLQWSHHFSPISYLRWHDKFIETSKFQVLIWPKEKVTSTPLSTKMPMRHGL